MQNISDTLKEAIRGTYQVPICKVELYEKDGSLAGELEILNVDISVASSRKVLRTIRLTLDNSAGIYTLDPSLYGSNTLWYNKTMKVYFGYKTGGNYDIEEWLPQGKYTIDSIDPDPEQGIIEIEGQDFMSKLIIDAYEDVYKLQGVATESIDFANGKTGSASSYTTGHEPDKVTDGDLWGTYWSPAPGDLAPYYQVDLGSSQTINVMYVSWGDHHWDIWKRYFYKMQYSADGISWTDLTDLNGKTWDSSLFGHTEHVFSATTCRYIRFVFNPDKLSSQYPIKLRSVAAQMITSTYSVNVAMETILAAAGVTDIDLPISRRYIKDRYAPIGEAKERLPRLIANSIGWVDPYYDENGVYRSHFRDINPVEPAWVFDVETDNIFNYSPQYSSKFYNVIIVSYKSSTDKAFYVVAEDNNPNSPTNTTDMGRRVYTYENQEFDDESKARIFAQQKLYDRTRIKHRTNLPVTGHPGLQPDDVVIVNIPEMAAYNVLYAVTGFDIKYSADGPSFDTDIRISQLDALGDEEETG